ncbi:MAG TPA: protein translocase subunit SecD, partial [Oceanospirillales bacterium]|nr:protein translocase subunit SecD [Oceanospirillales bacterium]
MNRYPLWKNLLILVILALGVFYALPNIYERAPVIQTSALKNQNVDEKLIADISEKLKAGNIKDFDINLENDSVITRFHDVADQLAGKEIINNLEGYKSALNLRTFVPNWLADAGGKAMNLGLDLMGGVYFLMEVDMKAALANKYNQIRGDVIQILSKNKISKKSIKWINK